VSRLILRGAHEAETVTVGATSTGLKMIDVASGAVLGNDESIPEPLRVHTLPREALERVLIRALSDPPCGVCELVYRHDPTTRCEST
jgi:hypothetical protein